MSKFSKFFGISGSVLSVVIAALLSFTAGFAQLNTSKIEGTVRDKDKGTPLPGVQALVEGTRLGNVTNTDGYYFILNVPPGRRSITFIFMGYQKTTVANQLILAGQTATVNANLSSTVIEMKGVTVEGESEVLVPRDQTSTKRRMTAASISEIPATKLEDMIALEAGVQLGGQEGFSRSFQIRGGRRGEEAMVVDGVTVRNYTADPFKTGVGWHYEQEEGSRSTDPTPLEFGISAVEEVDIITGGFQAEYGNAQSGIINIVTKEGTPEFRGNVRLTTDEVNPRTADYGYNQLQANIGGPILFVPNLYFFGSGELQGTADRWPSHADEGFRGINQRFVDRLNYAVRNDPVLDALQPVFTLDGFKTGRKFYADKTGSTDYSLWSPTNPVRQPRNWSDRTVASGKLTYAPIKGLKFLGSANLTRNQNSYPQGRDGNYFHTGRVTITTLPSRAWDTEVQRYPDMHPDPLPDTVAILHEEYGRRTRTSNVLAGFDYDVLQTTKRSALLQFRFTHLVTRDINSANIKDNYLHDKTFMSWTPHDMPFLFETFPTLNAPLANSPESAYYLPDGKNPNLWGVDVESPLGPVYGTWLYTLYHDYSGESQNNYKGDLDYQIDRWNRAKVGLQLTTFKTRRLTLSGNTVPQGSYDFFKFRPRMIGAYVQNRTDLGDFVFNYGLRYDQFQPRDNWGFKAGDIDNENYFPHNIAEWSPRFDVGFPVTDKSQVRFSYGVFTQLPSLYFIFNGSNPGGLEYSRTDAFEVGWSYLLSTDIVMDMVAYYRDVDGNLANKTFFRDYTQWKTGRRVRGLVTGYTNRDNGNIKGMDITFRKRFSKNFAFNAVYTMQFSRTIASAYNSTDYYSSFMDPSTGDIYRPPDELRPIEGDRTHKLTLNLNYLFPEDFQAGNLANLILKNFRAYAVYTLQSGAPIYDRVASGGRWSELENRYQQTQWMTRRGEGYGYVIGGLNYFRNRWDYNLDLRLSKGFNLGSARRLEVFCEILNALNQKPAVEYPAGYTYANNFAAFNGGRVLNWDDNLRWQSKLYFVHDYNGDGILSLVEQAEGQIAYNFMNATMDKTSWGFARQIRSGLQFTF